ncbi:hypothetical protein F7Q99_38595 [Streptomyces kaniharaensis]|uniref:Uncharacterized protein n=1 Tax=Streptomyces kaniharaensis TaxID=212423 RepID=A0A6N7L1S6_9ACTN|nr:hypothetical protein [Streptomyces kaniharaensis]MQS17946.1 hypothetical protein [Streptomyces kaniharaensis]
MSATEAPTLLEQCQQDYRSHQASADDRRGACAEQRATGLAHGNESAGAWGSPAPGVPQRY